MLPRVRRLAVQAELPLALVEVAKALTCRHDEAVIQQPHLASGGSPSAVELHAADQGLVAQYGELGVLR